MPITNCDVAVCIDGEFILGKADVEIFNCQSILEIRSVRPGTIYELKERGNPVSWLIAGVSPNHIKIVSKKRKVKNALHRPRDSSQL